MPLDIMYLLMMELDLILVFLLRMANTLFIWDQQTPTRM